MNKNTEYFIDPAINRKSRIVKDALAFIDGWPLPSVIEISESGTCNRKCVFCPRSDPKYPDVQEFISADLINKLASELSQYNYSGIFLFSGFVEPMLDKDIFSHIQTVRNFLPNARIEMVTNGDVLNIERLSRLFESGLSTILISVYDSKDDAVRFESMCLEAQLNPSQFVIRHRYLSEDQTFGITINNRAGMMSHAQYAISPPTRALDLPCHYPHYTFFMDYLGDVLMCPHDWGKKKIMGNIKKQSFTDVWLSKGFLGVRKLLASGNRTISPCNVCDVKGNLMGGAQAAAWAKYSSKTDSL
jgi:radical SAM protein with 4Fe4S-binding SPASM domain